MRYNVVSDNKKSFAVFRLTKIVEINKIKFSADAKFALLRYSAQL